MIKYSIGSDKSQLPKENSQTISQEQLKNTETETKLEPSKISERLSIEQLQEAISMGSLLADNSELMKLKQKYLTFQKTKQSS